MRRNFLSVFLMLAVITASYSIAYAAQQVSLAGDDVKILAGGCWRKGFKTISVKGILKDGDYISGYNGGHFAIFEVRGYDYFTAELGVSDVFTDVSESISFEVDGNLVKQITQKSGQLATPIQIALTGKQTLKIIWSGSGLFAINPKLVKGSLPAQPAGSSTVLVQPQTTSPSGTAQSASFVVDPKELDTLAAALRKRVDGKADLKLKIQNGNVALMTFSLIDVPSRSIAMNVAEGLSTSLINSDFPLVERGQLDKVLGELKIQESAMIDPVTAQKIGKMSGCDIILVGSISDQGQFVVINSRLLDTATGKALAAERIELRKITIDRK